MFNWIHFWGQKSRIVGRSLWRTQSCSIATRVDADPRSGSPDPVRRSRVRPSIRVSLARPLSRAYNDNIPSGVPPRQGLRKVGGTQSLSRAYKKRVTRRLRLANKPMLDEAQFNKALTQLPARFTAHDLHNIIALEDDPLVCLELFHWSSKLPRFKHSVDTFHITIQKLGLSGMMDQMYDVVNQLLALPHLGSELLYNTIIYYFTKARKLSRAITVFKHMKKVNDSECRPSIKTYNLLFAAFLSRGRNTYINHMYMGTMESLFRQLLNDGFEPDIFILNSMIQGYVLSNHVNDSLRIFHQMGVVYSCSPDVVTYDHVIYGLCAQGRTNNARELFSQMKGKGFFPSSKTYNSLVNALALAGEFDDALRFLWEMAENKRTTDFITYKTLLDEFCQKGKAAQALSLLEEFEEKCVVDGPIFKRLSYVVKDAFANGRNYLH